MNAIHRGEARDSWVSRPRPLTSAASSCFESDRAKPPPELEPEPGLGIAAVIADADLEARYQRARHADGETASCPLQPEPSPGHVGRRRRRQAARQALFARMRRQARTRFQSVIAYRPPQPVTLGPAQPREWTCPRGTVASRRARTARPLAFGVPMRLPDHHRRPGRARLLAQGPAPRPHGGVRRHPAGEAVRPMRSRVSRVRRAPHPTNALRPGASPPARAAGRL